MGNQTNYIPLETAKNIIITALDEFNPELASRAAGVLYNDDRLNIVEVSETKTNMMQCRPAGITIEDVRTARMYIPDFSVKYGPYFTRQDNPTGHAVVDFEYDGSPRSIAWLSHELGHAIADDVQKDNGHSFKDFSSGEQEEQAYFVQHIVSQHLKTKMRSPDVQDDDLGEKVLKMSWDRAAQFISAGKVYEESSAKAPDERKAIALKALDQRHI